MCWIQEKLNIENSHSMIYLPGYWLITMDSKYETCMGPPDLPMCLYECIVVIWDHFHMTHHEWHIMKTANHPSNNTGERVQTRKPLTSLSVKRHCCMHSVWLLCTCCRVHLEEFLHLLWLTPDVCTPCGSEPMDHTYCGSHLVEFLVIGDISPWLGANHALQSNPYKEGWVYRAWYKPFP